MLHLTVCAYWYLLYNMDHSRYQSSDSNSLLFYVVVYGSLST